MKSVAGPTRGHFVVLEGAEGTGKSTQVRRLAEFLGSKGVEVVESREPGGTEVGERIRDLVLHGRGCSIPAETELLLILAARAAFVAQVVRPALERGAWVISDRFDLSTFAYQGYGRGLALDMIDRVNRVATGGVVPDLYVVLDLSVEEGRERQRQQGKVEDRIEGGGADFLARVREGYVELAAARASAVLIPGAGSADEVERLVQTAIQDRFPETFDPRGV